MKKRLSPTYHTKGRIFTCTISVETSPGFRQPRGSGCKSMASTLVIEAGANQSLVCFFELSGTNVLVHRPTLIEWSTPVLRCTRSLR